MGAPSTITQTLGGRRSFLRTVVVLLLVVTAQADDLEEMMARRLVGSYERNRTRLEEIRKELDSLPQPHTREPTGSGGFISHEQKNAKSPIMIVFRFVEPRKIDAAAIFPLRLYTDEIYSDNLYWPDQITIETKIRGKTKILGRRVNAQPLIRQSLPELIQFAPVLTDNLIIRATELQKHPHQNWHAAGFAEICIFSGAENVAPRASVAANSSRQGYHVLAKEFLTDGQTPLGLPELSSRPKANGFIKFFVGRQALVSPYVLKLTYPTEIPIDSIRIDPAIQHSYGQGFPVRFIIDLLDAQDNIVHTDRTYESYPLRPPGLNPYFSSWPEKKARSIRLKVLETSRPLPQAAGTIAISEITPLYKGEFPIRPLLIEEQHRQRTVLVNLTEPLDTVEKRALAFACDGLSQSGKILPLRQWIEGLAQRQKLLEEQALLDDSCLKTLSGISRAMVYGSLFLLVFVTGIASWAVVRNRTRLRKELRTTRASIASDLHDDVGSNLGTIILHVEDLQEQAETPRQKAKLDAIYRLTRESVFGLREVLATTTPEVGRTQNIVAYMQELAGLILGNIQYSFNAAPAMSESLLDHRLRKGILLFYKEALYNARKHSGCSHIEISLQRIDNRIQLNIADNGQGIDEQTRKRPRNLRTLKQRAERLHADLQVDTVSGKGTKYMLSIPL